MKSAFYNDDLLEKPTARCQSLHSHYIHTTGAEGCKFPEGFNINHRFNPMTDSFRIHIEITNISFDPDEFRIDVEIKDILVILKYSIYFKKYIKDI